MTAEEFIQYLDPRPKYDVDKYESTFKYFVDKGVYNNQQVFLYAFIIGIHLGVSTSLPRGCNAKDVYPLNLWQPQHMRDIVYYLLLNRLSERQYKFSDLVKADDNYLGTFKTDFVRYMNGYANTGLEYITKKRNEDPVAFNQPFILADILMELKNNTDS